MSHTKRELIEAAYEEIGYSEYAFDLPPEKWQMALLRLDRLMAVWHAQGTHLGYPLPSKPTRSTLDQDSEIPDWANEAVITALAVRLAPTVGKRVSPETSRAAALALQVVQNRTAKRFTHEYAGPAGAGYRLGNRWIQPQSPDIEVESDDNLNFS